MAEEMGESRNQIQRFIRLTNLIPELLDLVGPKENLLQSRCGAVLPDSF